MSDGAAGNPDLMALMREAYSRGVEAWSSALEDLVGNEEFAAGSAQLLALYAQQQEGIRTASRLAVESLQVPTAEDLARVAGLVINVERKVEEVAESTTTAAARLAAIEAGLKTPPAPAGLGAIEQRLAAIEQRLAAPAAAPALPPDLDARLAAIESRLATLAAPAPAAKRTGTAKRTTAASKRTTGTGAGGAAKRSTGGATTGRPAAPQAKAGDDS